MSTPAQDEADRLFSNKDTLSTHPEDIDAHSSTSSRPSLDAPKPNDLQSHSDSSDDDAKPRGRFRSSGNNKMATTSYHLPTTIFDANTGPKGVIADAQSFDRAKKRSFRQTLLAFSNSASSITTFGKSRHEASAVSKEVGSSSEGSDDEEFMKLWRENRMQELQQGNSQVRRVSPSKRRYGTFDDVDANGYLDAVERVPSDTVVVVCIYDPVSAPSALVEDALSDLARLHTATRFIKLHHEIAEMDHVGAPAVIAYKSGDVFATLVEIPSQIPSGKSLNASSMEDLMRTHRILS